MKIVDDREFFSKVRDTNDVINEKFRSIRTRSATEKYK